MGNNTNGKLATRYDLTPQFALRTSLSNGFHAPTVAQSHFSDTVVYPSSTSAASPTLSVQLPVASRGGVLLGEPALKPEKSNNINFGLVAEPLSGLSFTLDFYRIALRDRIIDTGFIPEPNAPATATKLALDALAANGNDIAPDSIPVIQFFTNGVDTRTQGADFSADYTQNLGESGKFNWLLDGNFNQTKVTNVRAPSEALAKVGVTYINPKIINELTEATPRSHIVLAVNYKKSNWEFTLRETRYGYASYVSSFTADPYTKIPIQPAYITDINISYLFTERVKLSVGAINVLDKLPPAPVTKAKDTEDREGNRYPINTPWSYLGASIYLRLSASF